MGDILYDVSAQIKAIERMEPVHTFLYDTFVHNEGAVLAEDARFDFMKGNIEMAPFVVPGSGGKEMDPDVFDTRSITFPTIAPERTVNYMQYAKQRMLGEPITGSYTPDARLKKLLARDFAYLRQSIQLRREWMAAQVIFTGRLDILEYLEGGQAVKATRAADYKFTNNFISAKPWNQDGADVYGDIMMMCDMVREGQGTPQIMIFGTDVRACMLRDKKLRNMLDVRHAYFGEIRPGKMQSALQYIGTLSDGMEMYCYTGSYHEKKKGPRETFIPARKVMIGSSKMLRCIHGPIAQVEKENELPKVYANEEVPFRYSKTGGSSVQQRLSSRPMILPVNVDGWAVGEVLA